MQVVDFTTRDEVSLTGRIYEHENPVGVTVIHGATGVPHKYYEPFAQWLVEHRAHHVLIYAYRDTYRPTPEQLRKSNTMMSDWGLKDQLAANDFMLSRFPELPLHTVGHSLGGFCLPFHDNADRIVTHTAVNSGLAYWRSHPPHYLPMVILFWFILGPLMTRILGYLPGFLLGMKDGIPANVFWQWRRWCTNPDFHAKDWGKTLPEPDLNRFAGKLRLVSSSDDLMIPTSRVLALSRFFPAASSTETVELKPGDFGLKSIGHIQLFSRNCSSAWPAVVA